jgi:hypothetical protein
VNLKRKSHLLVCSFLVAAQTLGLGSAGAQSVEITDASKETTNSNVSAENSPTVTQVTYTTDTTAPSTPANLISTGKTASTVSLSWNASTDNVGVKGYDVYSNGAKISSVTGTSFTASGLTPNTAYSFTVKAFERGMYPCRVRHFP